MPDERRRRWILVVVDVVKVQQVLVVQRDKDLVEIQLHVILEVLVGVLVVVQLNLQLVVLVLNAR